MEHDVRFCKAIRDSFPHVNWSNAPASLDIAQCEEMIEQFTGPERLTLWLGNAALAAEVAKRIAEAGRTNINVEVLRPLAPQRLLPKPASRYHA